MFKKNEGHVAVISFQGDVAVVSDPQMKQKPCPFLVAM